GDPAPDAAGAQRPQRGIVLGGVEDDLGRASSGNAVAGRCHRLAWNEHRPAVRKRLHLVGLRRLQPADAKGAPAPRKVGPVLTGTRDADPLARQRVTAQLRAHAASTCPSLCNVSWSSPTSTSCTAIPLLAAWAAARPAAWPSSMYVGSIRTDAKATCDAERQTGTIT